MTSSSQIMSDYLNTLKAYLDTYMDRWVRHASRKDRISPGLVERVDISFKDSICTVRWADNKITYEFGEELEILS